MSPSNAQKGKKRKTAGSKEAPFPSPNPSLPLSDPGHYGLVLPDSETKHGWYMAYRADFKPTRFPCSATLRRLGLHDDVWTLFGNVGWKHLMEAKWNVYKPLVCEFLSAFQLDKRRKLMTFRMGNVSRTLSAAQFNTILKVPQGGLSSSMPGFDSDVLWKEVTGVSYVSNRAKSSDICNPVIRYVNRVLAFGLCGREHNTGVTVKETAILHCMLTSTNFDVGFHLMEHFAFISMKEQGVIYTRAFVTAIAEHFRFQHDYTPVEGLKELDMDALRRMQIISSKDEPCLILPSEKYFLLPNTPLTTILSRENLLMDTPAHKEWINDGEAEDLGVSTRSGQGGLGGMNALDQTVFLQSLQTRLLGIEGTSLSNYDAMGKRLDAMEERHTERHAVVAHELREIRTLSTKIHERQVTMEARQISMEGKMDQIITYMGNLQARHARRSHSPPPSG